MKKILFVRFADTPFGGAQRYLKRLDKELKKRAYDTDIIYSKLPKKLPSWLKVILFDRYVQNIANKEDNALVFSLERVSRVDIYRAGDGVHKAYLRSKGFSLNPLHLAYLWLEKQTFNNARLIIANSNMVKEQIINYYGIDKKKIKVVYNGVPIPESVDKTKAIDKLKREFGIDSSLPIILFVGSGFARKGVSEFLKIVSSLQTPFNAFVVGKEKHIKRYQQYSDSLGISDRVIFTGARSDVDIFYDASDIFLFPTKYEPFSNVVLEAMSRGCVVFTTRQNGASEIIDDYFVMNTPDDLSVSSKIDTLINDSIKLKEYQQKAKERAKEFSIERNADETLTAIEPFLLE